MESKSSMISDERSIDKLKKYQLPNKAKKIGWLICGIAFIALFLTDKDTNYKLVAKYSLLIGLLIVSISREKIEDELIKNLRMHSFTFAFIFAVFIAITNPLLSYLANFVFSEKQGVFDGIGDWMILWLLLSVQIFYFEYLKRLHN
ncbi:hypothetical protein [Spongiimicrobium salis]|uniref:hypothetical protein n=1 Tax=Spongiimicrobium salis TaxID=1667022 RepID=UPI00374D0FB8